MTNWQWVPTERGAVLRDLDAPTGKHKDQDIPRGVYRDGTGIILTVPPWTPGARRYVTDKKSKHYGQPIETHARDRANIKAATNGRYEYRHPGDH